MPNISPLEIVLLLLAALLLFGAKRLPEMGRSLGQGMREFKEAITGQSKVEAHELPPPASQVTTPTPQDEVAAPEPRKTEHVS